MCQVYLGVVWSGPAQFAIPADFDWLTDSSDWLTDSSDWLTDYSDWLTDWLFRLTDWLFRLTDSSDWLTDWLFRLTDWLFRLTDWLTLPTDWLTDSSDWLTDSSDWLFLYALIEPALFVLRKLILQMCMRKHPVWLDVWFFVGPFVYFHTSYVRTAKALARLCGCAGSPEPSLVAYVISTIISWAGSIYGKIRFSWTFTIFQKVCLGSYLGYLDLKPIV